MNGHQRGQKWDDFLTSISLFLWVFFRWAGAPGWDDIAVCEEPYPIWVVLGYQVLGDI